MAIGKTLSKSIILSEKQWQLLKNQLTNDYAPSVMNIRGKMKEVLGFTVRHHRWYTEQHGYRGHVCLDFYNEPKRTMLLLKYTDYFGKTDS